MPDVLGSIAAPDQMGSFGGASPPQPDDWRTRLQKALTLKPYLDPMQPVHMAQSLYGMAKSGFTLPHDVYQGQVDPMSDEAIKRSANLAMTAPMASFAAGPVEGAVGTGAAKLPPVGAWEKFAEEFPPVAPPEQKIDPKTGASYLGKGTTPEIKAFKKDRASIQKDIEAGNYNPFFDVSKRYDANPALFSPFDDTSSIVRATPETRAKYEAHAADPTAVAKLSAAFDIGMQNASTTGNWYMVGQLADEYAKVYGPEEGAQAFKTKFADAMAATTGGADPTANLLMSQFGNYLWEGQKPTPTAAYEMPFPIGGRYVTGNMGKYDKMIRQGEGVTPANPKRYNFSGGFQGNPSAMTIDEQMSAPYGMSMPPKGTYGHYQQGLGRLASGKGVDPRYFQEVAWAGLKDSTGKPMMQHVNEAVERTSRLTGAAPDEVVKEALVKSARPLYSNPKEASVPAFFSALHSTVESSPLNKASPEQWLGTVRNAGVKPDELQWSGFEDWLKGQKGPVTKQQATDYLSQNPTDVQTVMKGENDRPILRQISDTTDEDGMRSVRLQDQTGRFWDAEADPGRPFHIMDMGHDPNNSIVQATWQGEPPTTIEGVHEAIARHARGENVTGDVTSGTKFGPNTHPDMSLPGGENYKEMLLTLPGKEVPGVPGYLTNEAEANAFRSGHFDEPNVLAHVRMNDRVDANGKKTLFLEEVQSDWHQKGRKSGYIGESKEAVAKRWAGASGLRWDDLTPEQQQNNIIQEPSGSRFSVPDAPFKKDWHELALKRAIKYAADNGYDQVAWTPGSVQAERYDLSKHMDALEWVERDGEYYIGATKNGKSVFNSKATPEKLPDLVGKEMADKIVGQKSGKLSGLDLKVGGEGMNAFYDKMLPAAANKIGKKYGAQVGRTHLGEVVPGQTGTWLNPQHKGLDVHTLPITDAMRTQAQTKGFPLFTAGAPLITGRISNMQIPQDNENQ